MTSLRRGPRREIVPGRSRAAERPPCSSPASSAVSVPPNASASTPSRTPAGLADGGSGHADTINSYPTRAACIADLRDHAVRLMKRRGRHGLCGCCDGQNKCNSDQPDHCFLHVILSRRDFLKAAVTLPFVDSTSLTQVKVLSGEHGGGRVATPL